MTGNAESTQESSLLGLKGLIGWLILMFVFGSLFYFSLVHSSKNQEPSLTELLEVKSEVTESDYVAAKIYNTEQKVLDIEILPDVIINGSPARLVHFEGGHPELLLSADGKVGAIGWVRTTQQGEVSFLTEKQASLSSNHVVEDLQPRLSDLIRMTNQMAEKLGNLNDLSSSGHNRAEAQLKPDAVDWRDFKDAVNITSASSPVTNHLVMFFDPDCPACKRVLNELVPAIDKGIAVSLVPYTVRENSSLESVWCEPESLKAKLLSMGFDTEKAGNTTLPVCFEDTFSRYSEIGGMLNVTQTPSFIEPFQNINFETDFVSAFQSQSQLRSNQ